MLQVTLHVGRATVKVILTACGLHEIQTQDVLALLGTLVSMFSSNQYSKNQTALIQQHKNMENAGNCWNTLIQITCTTSTAFICTFGYGQQPYSPLGSRQHVKAFGQLSFPSGHDIELPMEATKVVRPKEKRSLLLTLQYHLHINLETQVNT